MSPTADGTRFGGGFTDPSRDAARAFRTIMTVLARPGEIGTLDQVHAPAPLSQAQAALILTLCDTNTGVHLAGAADDSAVRDWVRFHTGAPLVAAEDAEFAVGTWDALQPLDRFAIGTSEYPDRSATLFAEVPVLAPEGATLKGPGIRNTARLSLPETGALQDNATLFPLGFDVYFTCGTALAGLPRSTQITAEDAQCT
ncbi:phosphonate C-P lyase system protein PhnH [Chachezhania antarctica]|uniref:phosphonate C-P lyase system protein PhnH n=1 Tax=Chachezhania antarctica TaxID=2340860 RepID=UPI000EAE4ECE|nr:phosphonate C-P lyase system protein PhnH [Chachezhania antarctica]|tara:strand:- start:8703 stop:9299 length:597 start_codon:yes stop_codon:yes gene_type:complete